MKKAVRQIEREMAGISKEEKKTVANIKKLAKEGQTVFKHYFFEFESANEKELECLPFTLILLPSSPRSCLIVLNKDHGKRSGSYAKAKDKVSQFMRSTERHLHANDSTCIPTEIC